MRPLNRYERLAINLLIAISLFTSKPVIALLVGMAVAEGVGLNRSDGVGINRSDGVGRNAFPYPSDFYYYPGINSECCCNPCLVCSNCADTTPAVLIVTVTATNCGCGCCYATSFHTEISGAPGGTYTCYCEANIACSWRSALVSGGFSRTFHYHDATHVATGPCAGPDSVTEVLNTTSVLIRKGNVFGLSGNRWGGTYFVGSNDFGFTQVGTAFSLTTNNCGGAGTYHLTGSSSCVPCSTPGYHQGFPGPCAPWAAVDSMDIDPV